MSDFTRKIARLRAEAARDRSMFRGGRALQLGNGTVPWQARAERAAAAEIARRRHADHLAAETARIRASARALGLTG
jgi:hypothetical protein